MLRFFWNSVRIFCDFCSINSLVCRLLHFDIVVPAQGTKPCHIVRSLREVREVWGADASTSVPACGLVSTSGPWEDWFQLNVYILGRDWIRLDCGSDSTKNRVLTIFFNLLKFLIWCHLSRSCVLKCFATISVSRNEEQFGGGLHWDKNRVVKDESFKAVHGRYVTYTFRYYARLS